MSYNRKYKYAALCIGINQYENNKHLSCAVNDAEAMASVFTDLKYDVVKLIEQDANVERYSDTLEDLMRWDYEKRYDAIILYFAGHGFATDNMDCLALWNCAKMEYHGGLVAMVKSISVQDFIDKFRHRGVPNIIVILDACRTDLSDYSDMQERGVYTKPIDFGKNTQVPSRVFIAYSTSVNSGASDIGGANGHSKYTAALLDEIKKEEPIETVFKKVRSKVHLCDEDQLPWEYTCLTDEFFFNYGQLEPYYNAEYSKDAFMYFKYYTGNKDAQSIIDRLKSGDKAAIEDALISLISKKGSLSNDDLFVIGRYIYLNASRNIVECREYLTSKTIKLFGGEINHLLRGIYYEMYFDENDVMRPKALGDIGVLAIADNLQRIMKGNDAAKFVKQYVDKREGNFIFEIWDMTTVLNVDVVSEEMYCTDNQDNIIYGVRNVVVDGEEILSKMQLELQDIVTKDQLRLEIAKTLSVPSRRLKIKGLEEENGIERSYMMFYVDEIELDLLNAINDNLPDEIVSMSSHSYIDELYAVTIEDISYDGCFLTVEGSCNVVVHNEIDHEEMPDYTAPCEFVAKCSEDNDSHSFKVDEGDFTVNTRSYYRQPDLFEV